MSESTWEFMHLKVPPELKERYRKLAIKMHKEGLLDRPIASTLYRRALKEYLEREERAQ